MTLALPSRRAVLAPGPWVRNELWRRARAVPSLDLRFAENKSLADAVSGQSLVTFTRASAGTYVGSDGLIKTAAENVPRFDHNPVTGECLGLLVEEQRTNLLLRSEEFDNAAWTGNTNVTPNTSISPAGTTTADTLAISTPGTWLLQSVAIASGATLAFSVHAKELATAFALIRISNSTNTSYRDVWFDLSSGSVATAGGSGGDIVSAVGAIEQSQNGFYRISVIAVTSGITNAVARITTVGSDGSFTRAGSIYIWGADLQPGAFPTSYIPTTDSAATRSADVASISGSNYSGWFNASQGTMFADVIPLMAAGIAGQRAIAVFSDGTYSNSIGLSKAATDSAYRGDVFTGGSAQAALTGSSYAAGQASRLALGYASNNVNLADNGQIGVQDNTVNLPTGLNRLDLRDQTGASLGQPSVILKRLTYWPQRLSNSTLQSITA